MAPVIGTFIMRYQDYMENMSDLILSLCRQTDKSAEIVFLNYLF